MPDVGETRVLVLYKNLTYDIFETDELDKVKKAFEENDGDAIYKLEGYMRKRADGDGEPSVRCTRVYPPKR